MIKNFIRRPIWKMAVVQMVPSRTSVDQFLTNQHRKQVQLRLAVVMSLTVFEFILFQLPAAFVIFSALYGKISGDLKTDSYMATFCFSLWYVDAIINPLWMVPLAKGQRRSSEIANSRSLSLSKSAMAIKTKPYESQNFDETN